jgi:putative phosphoesterase
MTNDSRAIIDPGFGMYAADTMLALLLKLQDETTGIKRSDEIEFLHQSRVFSRRVRAALDIFSSCLPEKQVNRWKKGIRDITRALGEARDMDVQIEYIKSYMKEQIKDKFQGQILFNSLNNLSGRVTVGGSDRSISNETEKDYNNFGIGLFFQYQSVLQETENISPGYLPIDPIRPGLECLLIRLIKRRETLQPGIIKAIEELERSDLIRSISTWFHEIRIKALLEDADKYSKFSYEQAFLHIMLRMQDLFWYETWLSDPKSIERHHQMRIAAKHLRYTLEIFGDLYEDNLKPEIKIFKKLQDTIGEMHDCDVWIQRLPEFIESEKRATIRYFGNEAFFELINSGLSDILLNRRLERDRLFSNLQNIWASLKEEGFWDKLEEKISAPLLGDFVHEVSSCSQGSVKIALISDIHANLPALEAVLEDAKNRGVSAVLNAGDSIGYGAFPDDVISLLKSSHVLSVSGNYDKSVLTKKWKRKRLKSHDKQIAMRYAYHNVKAENRAYLKSLPDHLRIKIRNKSILVTHGSPDSQNEYLVRETPESRFSEIAKKADADIIVTGHSHLPLIMESDGVWFVNCGSVGRTEDGDPRACYALLTLDPFSVIHIRVAYDIDRAINALRMRHLPDSFVRSVSEGKPFDVLEESLEQN